MDRSRPGQEASWPVQNPKIQLAPNPLAYGFVGAVLNGLPAYQWPVKHPFRLPDVYYQRFYKNVNAGWVLVTRYFVCPPPPSTPDDPRYPANGIAYFETEEQAWTMAHYYRQLNLTYPRRAEMVRFDGSLRLQLVNIARTMKCMDIFQVCTKYLVSCLPWGVWYHWIGHLEYVQTQIIEPITSLTITEVVIAGQILQRFSCSQLEDFFTSCYPLTGDEKCPPPLSSLGMPLLLGSLMLAISWEDDDAPGFSCRLIEENLKVPAKLVKEAKTRLLLCIDWNVMQFSNKKDIFQEYCDIVRIYG